MAYAWGTGTGLIGPTMPSYQYQGPPGSFSPADAAAAPPQQFDRSSSSYRSPAAAAAAATAAAAAAAGTFGASGGGGGGGGGGGIPIFGAGINAVFDADMGKGFIPRPPHFDGSRANWATWKWDFLTFVAALNPDYLLWLEDAAIQDKPIPERTTDSDVTKGGLQIYGLIGSLVGGEAKVLLRNDPNRSGWDAYRRLVKHYEPKQVTRSVVWRAQLLKADLCK